MTFSPSYHNIIMLFCRCCWSLHMSLPIGTNDKTSAAIDKFPSTIGNLMIGKTLATNRKVITKDL